MRGVIFEAVPRAAVDQDIQAAAVSVEPRDQAVELGRVEGELAAPARVRPDELLVDPAHLHPEERRRLLAELPGLLDGALVEVDVGVIAGEVVAGSWGHGPDLP